MFGLQLYNDNSSNNLSANLTPPSTFLHLGPEKLNRTPLQLAVIFHPGSSAIPQGTILPSPKFLKFQFL
ncbi:hypothetical protein ACFX2F_001990 [Malus domestica]